MEVKRTYTIQENGQITLPREWREKLGLKKGDIVSYVETSDGNLVILPRVALAMDALEQIGQALQEKGITLEQLMHDGEMIREQIYKEKYAGKIRRDA